MTKLDPLYNVPIPDTIANHQIDKETFHFNNEETWPPALRDDPRLRKEVRATLAKLRAAKINADRA